MSHTPGPWRTLDESEDNAIWVESPTWMVAKVLVDVAELQEEGPANARLIAAAPQLLEALKVAMITMENDYPRAAKAIAELIAKATGGAE